MDRYHKVTGERLNYDLLAERTGLSVPTLQSIAARSDYNTRLSTIDKLCQALNCSVDQLLVFKPDIDQGF